MAFYELLNKVVNLLEREGKASYRALQREFEIDAETIDDVRKELVEVKKIARDIDGEILELIPEKAPSSKEKQSKKSIPSKEDVDKYKDPIISELDDSHEEDETTKGVKVRNKKPKLKKHILKWLGATFVLVGVLLPWVSVRMQVAGSGMNYPTSFTGLDLTQGLLSIAAGIIGGIAGLIANKKPLSSKWLSLLILIAGVVIIGFTLDVIDGVSKRDLSMQALRFRQNPEAGVFITLLGGCLLFFSGLASLLRKKKAIKKV